MLEYLAKTSKYISKDEDTFKVRNCITIKHELVPYRLNQWITIDFKNHIVEVHSYDPSYYDEDHFNSVNTLLPWSALQALHSGLTNMVRGLAEEEVMYELKAKLVDERFNQIKNGNI